MLEKNGKYLVMGLLDPHSLAYAIGRAIQAQGAQVIYTSQSKILKKRYLDSTDLMTEEEKASLDVRFCDVSCEEDVARLFSELGKISGVVHSIAYANTKTCMGEELHTDAIEDIKKSYEISCISLATVARYAVPVMSDPGGIVALSFDTRHVYPLYNWMGVHKAALEALVRALARRHARDGIRVNAVSAGPLATTAASKIPGFDRLKEAWSASSLIPWDSEKDKRAVADAVVFLLSRMARQITGQVLTVDGGASIVGGGLLDSEKFDRG